jgi:hypothetical protein
MLIEEGEEIARQKKESKRMPSLTNNEQTSRESQESQVKI